MKEEAKEKLREAINIIAEAGDKLEGDQYLELSEIRKQLEDFEDFL